MNLPYPIASNMPFAADWPSVGIMTSARDLLDRADAAIALDTFFSAELKRRRDYLARLIASRDYELAGWLRLFRDCIEGGIGSAQRAAARKGIAA